MAHQRSSKQRRIPCPYKDSGDGRPSPAIGDTRTQTYMNSSVSRSLEIVAGVRRGQTAGVSPTCWKGAAHNI